VLVSPVGGKYRWVNYNYEEWWDGFLCVLRLALSVAEDKACASGWIQLFAAPMIRVEIAGWLLLDSRISQRPGVIKESGTVPTRTRG